MIYTGVFHKCDMCFRTPLRQRKAVLCNRIDPQICHSLSERICYRVRMEIDRLHMQYIPCIEWDMRTCIREPLKPNLREKELSTLCRFVCAHPARFWRQYHGFLP